MESARPTAGEERERLAIIVITRSQALTRLRQSLILVSKPENQMKLPIDPRYQTELWDPSRVTRSTDLSLRRLLST